MGHSAQETVLKLYLLKILSIYNFRHSFYNEVESACFNGFCRNNQRVQLVELWSTNRESLITSKAVSLKEFFTLKVSYVFKKLLTTGILLVNSSVGIPKCLHDFCDNDIVPLIKAWRSLIDKIVGDLQVETHSPHGYDWYKFVNIIL